MELNGVQTKNCIYCNSRNIYVVQLRKNLYAIKPIYLCKNCNRRFTPDDGFKKFRFSPIVIKTAIQLLSNGHSLSQITYYLNTNFRVKVSRKSILDWKKRYLNELGNIKG